MLLSGGNLRGMLVCGNEDLSEMLVSSSKSVVDVGHSRAVVELNAYERRAAEGAAAAVLEGAGFGGWIGDAR